MLLFLKGLIIGIGKIIPGVSGSLLAINFGVYEKALEAILHFFDHVKKNFWFLLKLGSGIVIAVVLGSRYLLYFFEHFQGFLLFFFLGLLIATSIPFYREINFVRKKDSLLFLIPLGISFAFFFFSLKNFTYNHTFLSNLWVFLLGAIDAITMIIPGISGTVIFLSLGSYSFLLELLSHPLNFPVAFVFYGIGLLFFGILSSVVMLFFLKKKKRESHIVLSAFSIVSLLFLGKEACLQTASIWNMLFFFSGLCFGILHEKWSKISTLT